LDKVFLHPVFGWVFLFGILGSIFWSVFIVSFYTLGWLNAGVNGVSSWLGHILSEGAWKGLVMDGILAGVGSIVVFLPQILILFFFLGCLESSGYLPRVAFLLDKVMRRFGLSGKAFIPMLTCYACAVPGIMGTRGLNVHQERFATILVAPWASCSARLPIYLLLINILCPNSSWGGLYKVVLLMGAYGFGTFGALILSRILRKTVFTGNSHGIMMDMPDYRWPALKNVAYQMVERTWIFLSKVGSIVLIFSMIFWALMHFPYHPKLTKSQNMEQSFAGRVGHLIEPALKPLGYDWKIGVGLLSSLGSRESFISTMSVMYHVEGDNDDGPPRTVQQLFAKQKDAHGNPLYSLATCLSLITFFVFAMQCMSTVAVVRRETNSTLWALFQLIFMNVVAYVLAFIVYHITP
jgi:ferrous iron transport protein B